MYALILSACVVLNAGLFLIWRNLDEPAAKTERRISAEQYFSKLDSIHDVRDSLGTAYEAAGNAEKKKQVLAGTKQIFLTVLQDDIFQSWYGTPWDFYGTSDTPQTGAIACGYFVTTALRDMGVKLNRRALAECASETMIRKLVDDEHIFVYRNKTIDEFTQAMLARGDGLYILGLDYHTGFLLCEDGKAYFIHAFPPGVRKESPYSAPYLADSKYRVAGSITADEGFFRRWILRESL